MFNWNAPIRGQGFPVQNPAIPMVSYGAPNQQIALNTAGMPFQPPQWGHQQHQFPQRMGMVPVMGQHHPQWQQMHQFPPQQQPGMFHPQGMRMGMIGGVNPVPPSYPPSEEKPPLPSEPPPPLPSTPHEAKPPLPNERPKPPLPKGEFGVLSNDGPRPPDEPAPEKPALPPRPPSPDPALLAELEKVKKEEQVFLEQYKQWKQQYDDWREQNQNHPNKDQYEQYLSQWKTYEGQMESRRISIAKQKSSLEEKIADNQQSNNAPVPEEQNKFSPGSKGGRDLGLAGDSESRLLSQRRSWTPSGRKESLNVSGGQIEQQKHHPLEGDDIGEEDMNLDDEEESAGGGIIESTSHPSHEGWPKRSSDAQEPSSQEPRENWDSEKAEKSWHSQDSGGYGRSSNEEPRFPGGPNGVEARFPDNPPSGGSRFPGGPHSGGPRFPDGPHGEGTRLSGGLHGGDPRFPGGRPVGGPRFSGGAPSGEPRFSRGPPSGESRFPGGSQESESSQCGGIGPSGYNRGRGRGEWGTMGQGPRFGWRGGGGPRFQGPHNSLRVEGFSEHDNSEWENHEKTDFGYEDNNVEEGADESGYTDQDRWYGETDNETQTFDRSDQGFLSNRGRGGPVAFRGRGGDFYGNRGGGFERGRGGSFGGGDPLRGDPGRFFRGGPSFRGRGILYGDETTDSDYYNASSEPARPRGRGSWPMRGRGASSQGPPPYQFGDDPQNNDVRAENDFDEVELQAQLQYEGDEDIGNQEPDNFSIGFHGRGRGGMFRGRGRGGFDTSYGSEATYQEEEQDYYENPQTDFGARGRGIFRGHGARDVGEPFRGRGRGDMNYAVEGMGRGYQRGRGAYRGRGGHFANFLESGGEEFDGAEDSREEFQDQDALPAQATPSGPYGRGRGIAGRPGFGRGAFAAGNDGRFGEDSESLQRNKDKFEQVPGIGFSMRPGRGRGAAQPQNSESRWDEGAYGDETEVPSERLTFENRAGDNNLGPERGVDPSDEPLIKRGRFDEDDQDLYGRLPPPLPRDHFDAYRDRYLDPFGRYPDSFSRDPYFDPYGPPYERLPGYDMYGRYDRAVSEKKSFVPAESIDYGHGEVDKEKKKAALQQKEVIDYGHGRSSEPRDDISTTTDRESNVRARPPDDSRGLARGRGWDVDEREDDQRKDYSRDDSYRVSQGRFSETFDYSRISGHEPSAKAEFGESYDDRQADGRFSDPARRNADSASAYNPREGEDISRGFGRSLEDPTRERRVDPGDPFGRNCDAQFGRDSDDRIKKDNGDSRDRDNENRYGRDVDNRYSRDPDDRYDRDREVRHGRDRDDRYGRDRSTPYDRDSNDPFKRGRDQEDRYKERDRLYNREARREESPRRRVSDVDDRYGGSSRRDSPLRKDEDFSHGRDYLRRDFGANRLADTREDSPFRGRRERDVRGDPYSSLGQDKSRNADTLKRWDDRDPHSMAAPREQRFGAMSRDLYGEGSVSSPSRNSPIVRGPPAPTPLPVAEVKKVEDLLCPPGRQSRPPQLVVIIRGLPGSGKTYVSKLLREKEIKFGGGAPRMLCLDDYFMVEVDKQEVDPDTGKKVKKKVMEYEYEQPLEEAYRQSLLKSFKKTVDDGFFPFIIVDATNEKVAHFAEFWSYAKSRGFQVYVGELNADVSTCIQRNIHNWTEWDIEKVKSNWEPLPNHYIRLDLRWLLQDDSIDEVEMEDTDPTETKEEEEEEEKDPEEDDEESGFEAIYKKSKWELDSSEKTLDKLDGIPVSKKHIADHQTLKDYLQLDQPDQLDDDYFSRESLPGKKRVRWADLEEKKTQNRRRDLGFIVGQTQRDWDRITDDDFAEKALNQTKYFYKN